MRLKSFPSFLTLVLILSFGAMLLMYPMESCTGAKEGLMICFNLIIPSLFPFFVLSSLLISLGYAAQLGSHLKQVMWPAFRLNGSCASAIILGALGGYPVGIRTTLELYEDRQCTKEDALHLSSFCNNCGPAFLFSVAGCGIFSSKAAGFLLLGTHLVAALLVGFFFRFYPFSKEVTENALPKVQKSRPFTSVFPDCVKDSFSATLNVCAFVILFSVLLKLANCSGVLPFFAEQLAHFLPACFSPELCYSFIAGCFEISTGIYSLSEISQSPLALPLAAFMLGFGGLSVHCQSLPFLNRCVSSIAPYFLGKILQGFLAAGMTAIVAPFVLVSNTSIPIETISLGGTTFALLQQEIVALWFLSGGYFLFCRKKGLEIQHFLHYNKNRH